MTAETNLNAIREALAILSAVHASGAMTREDMNAAQRFVEARCDEIAAALPPCPAGHGISTIPMLSLRDVAREARADRQRAAGRRHLAAVPSSGDAA